jgi:pilus assembly protein CpaD
MKITTLNILHSGCRTRALLAAAVCGLSSAGLAGCSNPMEPIGHVAAFTMVDPSQRHPIIVSDEPASLALTVSRGSDGLSPHQRANFSDFLGRYRGSDTGNGQLSISVPSGSSNEISALRAVADMREIVRSYGIDDSRVAVAPYRAGSDRNPQIRVSYNKFVAHAPDCGSWPTNIADDPANLPHPNLGCATQRNFAMQVANPADLLGPRTMTPATAERRDTKWRKFNEGDTTVAKKDAEEKASAKSEN